MHGLLCLAVASPVHSQAKVNREIDNFEIGCAEIWAVTKDVGPSSILSEALQRCRKLVKVTCNLSAKRSPRLQAAVLLLTSQLWFHDVPESFHQEPSCQERSVDIILPARALPIFH